MKHPRYNDKQRAAAVAMLQGMGYPEKKGALTAVYNHTGIPLPTLSRWFRGTSNPPPNDIVNETKIDLVSAIKKELADLFPAMGDARDGASYKELATAAGILIDKLQLLEGKPTAINEERASDARNKLMDLVSRRAPEAGTTEGTEFIH